MWNRINFSLLLSVISIVITIAAALLARAEEQVILGLLMVVSVCLLLSIGKHIYDNTMRNIRFYEKIEYLPKRFKTEGTLRYIAKNHLNLTAVGRTNLSWFEGIDPGNRDGKKIKLYRKAVGAGCEMHFIIQHRFVQSPNLDSETVRNIEQAHKKVVEAFLILRDEIKSNKIRLSFTSQFIENSMTRIYTHEDRDKYFLYDIGQNLTAKPKILFYDHSIFNELREKFNGIVDKAMDYYLFKKQKEEADRKVEALIASHDQCSLQRENHNRKLVSRYFARQSDGFVPPISIQLLITNSCSSKCVMCGHHDIKTPDELRPDEIKDILHYIHDMGTRNVIISGGEPLNKKGCLEILEHGRRELGLNFGLLTNGIKYGTKSLDDKDAEQIKASCDWVQLSIDSFNPDVYKEIRGGVDYRIVEETLKNLRNAEVNVEICYTIQKLNIDEAIEIVQGTVIPQTYGVHVRFKFAHGPDKDKKFLVDDRNKINMFKDACSIRNKNEGKSKNKNKNCNCNAAYLDEMFKKRYFTSKDIAEGTPLRSKTNIFSDNKYRCQVIDYSCKIDAVGDVYPCCYLFDDNQGDSSEIRSIHYLGSLRTNGHSVDTFVENRPNILRGILHDNHLLNNYRLKFPIDENACDYCTRHFYQNEFLNELEKIAKEYEEIKYTYGNAEEEDYSKIWI